MIDSQGSRDLASHGQLAVVATETANEPPWAVMSFGEGKSYWHLVALGRKLAIAFAVSFRLLAASAGPSGLDVGVSPGIPNGTPKSFGKRWRGFENLSNP